MTITMMTQTRQQETLYASIQPSADHAEIIKLIEAYIQSSKLGKSDNMKHAFHRDTKLKGFVDGKQIEITIEEFFKLVEAQPAKELEAYPTRVDLFNDVAIATVTCLNWSGINYTDIFTMIKQENGWIIVSKTFTGSSAA